jgi:hypothetical protein
LPSMWLILRDQELQKWHQSEQNVYTNWSNVYFRCL